MSLPQTIFILCPLEKRIERAQNKRLGQQNLHVLFVKKAFENNITNPYDYEKRTIVLLTNITEHNNTY